MIYGWTSKTQKRRLRRGSSGERPHCPRTGGSTGAGSTMSCVERQQIKKWRKGNVGDTYPNSLHRCINRSGSPEDHERDIRHPLFTRTCARLVVQHRRVDITQRHTISQTGTRGERKSVSRCEMTKTRVRCARVGRTKRGCRRTRQTCRDQRHQSS